jgi:hypothetical protein
MLVSIRFDKRPDKQALPNEERLKALFAMRLENNVKNYMYSGIFMHPTGALAASIRTFVVGNNIMVYSDKGYAEAQNYGTKRQTMWWLLGKTIPFRSFKWGFSSVTFRTVTLKSFLEGKWVRRAMPGKHFVREGLRMTRLEMPGLEMSYNIKEESGNREFV